jgi:RNA polymerase sigma factor (sigma-70 family)
MLACAPSSALAREALSPAAEADLVTRAARHDNDAWREILQRYQPKVFGFLHNRTGNRELAKELTQETFCAAAKAIAQCDGRGPFLSWLFAIARNRLIKHLRRQREAETLSPAVPAQGPSPAQHFEHREWWEKLKQFLQERWSEREVEMFVLAYIEDMPPRHIARVLGISTEALRVTRWRVIQSLPDHLKP